MFLEVVGKLNIELWVWEFVKRFGYKRSYPIYLHKDGELPMKIFCENKATVSIANERVQYDRTKHGDFVKHSIKKKLDKCSI